MKLEKIAITIHTILILALAAFLVACGPKAGAGPEPESPAGEEAEEEASVEEEVVDEEEDYGDEEEEEED